MADSRRSAERVWRGPTSGHGPQESRKKPALHLFLSGLCDTVGVNYREKHAHTAGLIYTDVTGRGQKG